MPIETYILKPLHAASLTKAFECFSGLRRFLAEEKASEGQAGGA
jgi:hypothetical protein